MDAGMDELADNLSQVTDPTSSSFDASTPPSLLPTGWKTGLMRSYCHKLHALPFDQHDELFNKINKVVNSFNTTGKAVSYTMFLIYWRTKNNKDAEKVRVTNNLSNIVNVNCAMKELETPAMIENLSSDDISQVSMLCDNLRFQREEQSKVTHAVFDLFENLGKGSKIEDKGANMMIKSDLAQTSAVFSQIPSDTTDNTMGEWMYSKKSHLNLGLSL